MLYYIHGYLSSPESTKGILLKEKLDAQPISYRDCAPEDLVISECLKRIDYTIKDDDNAVLIGSSLGGFLAASTALDNSNVKRLILLNPSIIPPETDLNKYQDIPRKILEDIIAEKRLFTQQLDAEVNILIGTADELIPRSWVLEFAMAQQATIQFLHDDHMFSKNMERLPVIIAKIINQ